MLVPCRYPIIRIRCTVRFDGCMMIGPSYPKAVPISIVTENRKGKALRTHGTLMGAPCGQRRFCNRGGRGPCNCCIAGYDARQRFPWNVLRILRRTIWR